MQKSHQKKASDKAPREVKDLKAGNTTSVKGGNLIAVSDSGVANPKPIVVPIKK